MSRAWMPMYWADYFGDTMHLSTEEHGAYLLLLGTYWRRGKALPDDDKWLASVTKMSTRKWKMVRPNIIEFFDILDGHLTSKRLEKEILRSSERSASASASAKQRARVSQPQPQSKSTTETPTNTELLSSSTENENSSGAGRSYAWQGSVIRLTAPDYERWEKSFCNLNLDAKLTALDAWWTGQPPDKRKKWFQATAGMLARDNGETVRNPSPGKKQEVYGV